MTDRPTVLAPEHLWGNESYYPATTYLPPEGLWVQIGTSRGPVPARWCEVASHKVWETPGGGCLITPPTGYWTGLSGLRLRYALISELRFSS